MDTIFSKYETSRLKLKNRVVMPPMSRYASDEYGFPSNELINYYLTRAKQGVGLIFIEAASIDSTLSKSYLNGLSFYSQEHSDVWKPIVKEIKLYGASVFMQLYHAGRLTTPKVCGGIPLAPSEIAPMKQRSHLMNVVNDKGFHFQGHDEFITPKEMNLEEIHEVQNKFALASELVSKSGFDGVDLHGAHGNLIHQFTSRHTNKRSDQYGKDQYLFLDELVQKCRSVMPRNKLLSLRLSQHMVDSSFIRFSKKYMDFEEIVRRTEPMVDIYNCSEVIAGTPMFGHTKSLTEEVRQYTKKTIITSGQINNTKLANMLLNSGGSDLIAIGRLLISNPNLVELLETGDEDKIIPFNNKIHTNTII